MKRKKTVSTFRYLIDTLHGIEHSSDKFLDDHRAAVRSTAHNAAIVLELAMNHCVILEMKLASERRNSAEWKAKAEERWCPEKARKNTPLDEEKVVEILACFGEKDIPQASLPKILAGIYGTPEFCEAYRRWRKKDWVPRDPPLNEDLICYLMGKLTPNGAAIFDNDEELRAALGTPELAEARIRMRRGQKVSK